MKKLALLTLIITLVLSTVSFAGLQREIWDGTATGTIDEAWAVVNGETPPTSTDVIGDAAIGDRGVDNYVQHLTGYVVAPADGDYTFYIASDDDSQLLLDGTVVSSVAGWAGYNDWGNANVSPSEPIALTAGQVVSLEAVHREGTGGDNLSIGWIVPGSTTVQVLPNADTYPTEAAMGMASAPSPVNGATGVVSGMLTWAAPVVGEAPVYSVSMGTDPEALSLVAEGLTEATYDAGAVGAELAFSTTYYWQVTVNGVGDVWSFTTADPVIINSVSGDAEPVGSPAALSVDAVSPVGAELTYQWHRLNFVIAAGIPPIADAAIPGAESAVYAVDAVKANDQGEYYCVVTSPDGEVATANVFLDVQTGLIHQYTFNDTPDGTTIPDVVGGADATLVNLTGNAVIADGQCTTGNDGSQSSNGGAGNTSGGDYVNLPNGIYSVLTQMTIECWTTWTDNTQGWARVYDFGTSNDGEDVSPGAGNAGIEDIYYSPKNAGDDGLLEYRLGGSTHQIYPGGRAPVNEEFMVTQVTDDKAMTTKLYINGVAVGGTTNLFTLKSMNDNNNWLGRSQWGDPLYVGSWNEYRIYDTALSAEQIAADYLAGPDAMGVLPAPYGGPALMGDLNGDGVYDFLDVAMYADRYLTERMDRDAQIADLQAQ